MKKFIFLMLTLAIPVSIFLFLKIFGNNEFEVPVFFENGIPGCSDSEKVHTVPDINLINREGEKLHSDQLNEFLIFALLDFRDKTELHERLVQLVRIQDAFYEIGTPRFILMADQKDRIPDLPAELSEVGLLTSNYYVSLLEEDELREFLHCGLGLEIQKDEMIGELVLVDIGRKIRGIYNGLDMEQTEQLILELKILRKQV
jgi:protein SCO1